MNDILIRRTVSALGIAAILSGFLFKEVGQIYATSVFSYLFALISLATLFGGPGVFLFSFGAVAIGWLLVAALYLLMLVTVMLNCVVSFVTKPNRFILGSVSLAYLILSFLIFIGLCVAMATRYLPHGYGGDQIVFRFVYFGLPAFFAAVGGYFLLLLVDHAPNRNGDSP